MGKQRKAITPIIAIIILLLITVALAGAAWTFLSGFLGVQIEKSFLIPPGGALCVSGGTVKVTVVNTGTVTITDEDFIILSIDGNTLSSTINPPDYSSTFSIAPQKGGVFVNSSRGGAGWSSGRHTVEIGTTSVVLQQPVVCP